MLDYDVSWSWESLYDVADIADYIELRFGPDRAEKFTDDIDCEGKSLGHNFRLYSGTGLYYKQKMIMKKVFGPSIIFYFVDDDKKTVYIVRVLRYERNWQKIMHEGNRYTFD